MVIYCILSSLAAIGLYCSFLTPSVSWLGLISLIPLIHTFVSIKNKHIQHKEKLKLIIQFWFIFSVLYMGLTNWWVFQLIEFSTTTKIIILFIIYTLIQAIFYTLIGAVLYALKLNIWFLPALWTCIEWLRSSGPFGSVNGVIGYSQASSSLAMIAQIGGIYLLCFTCISINLMLYSLIINIKTKQKKNILIVILLITIVSLTKNITFPRQHIDELATSIIQTNHPIAYKLKRKNRSKIRQDLINLSTTNNSSIIPELIIWPETISASQNLYFKSFMNQVTEIITKHNTSIIIGTPRKQSNRYFNSAVMLQNNKTTIYNKNHLMPFGEYWPFKNIFKLLKLDNIIPGSEFSKGKTITLFELTPFKIGTAICLETTTPQLYRKYTQQGATILVSLVNNGWFKTSSIADRQRQMLQIRAIENGRYILQASNMGYTCVIAPNGSIINQLNKFNQTSLNTQLNINIINTPYILFGDFIIGLSLIFILLEVIRKHNLKA